jgi:hypothetical protein
MQGPLSTIRTDLSLCNGRKHPIATLLCSRKPGHKTADLPSTTCLLLMEGQSEIRSRGEISLSQSVRLLRFCQGHHLSKMQIINNGRPRSLKASRNIPRRQRCRHLFKKVQLFRQSEREGKGDGFVCPACEGLYLRRLHIRGRGKSKIPRHQATHPRHSWKYRTYVVQQTANSSSHSTPQPS